MSDKAYERAGGTFCAPFQRHCGRELTTQQKNVNRAHARLHAGRASLRPPQGRAAKGVDRLTGERLSDLSSEHSFTAFSQPGCFALECLLGHISSIVNVLRLVEIMKNYRRVAVAVTPLVAALVSVAAVATPAAAVRPSKIIVLPGAKSAEGIALGSGSTFFAGDEFGGDIYRGDLESGQVEKFVDVPDGILDGGGKMAVGMKVLVKHNLLFVAGGLDGTARVYNTTNGTEVADLQLAGLGGGLNDVALTDKGAWFTDSLLAKLYFIPVDSNGVIGEPKTLNLTGPAADASSQFNNNGIVEGPDGKLIVGHTGQGTLNQVDPVTGKSSTISGVSLPNGVDGMIRRGTKLYVAHAFDNKIAEVNLKLDPQGEVLSGSIDGWISSDALETPTTLAQYGDQLAVINSHITKNDAGEVELPASARQYEVLVLPTSN
ncbi:SMP-30/gluconolactonase/LRE family protein [Streptomyces chartreusis]|uniref:hypothetical protein n=1 Tax=Streptomyces chartreusis TaxID=1969 RepID=UPI0036A59663